MAIETVFQELTTRFEAMREALQNLGLTVIEDRPLRDEVVLVDRLGDVVDELRGWAAEGLAAAAQAERAVADPLNGYRARQALAEANERVIRLEYKFLGEAASYETIGDLRHFAHKQGREWLGWLRGVQDGLQACRETLHGLDAALLQAWRELSERLGTRSVSLQTTAIGQQIGEFAGQPEARRGGDATVLKSKT